MTRVVGRCAALGLALVVLQLCVVQGIDIAGAHPELFVVVAVAAGLVAGPERGAIFGLFAGLVADLFLPTPFGLSALTFVLVAFAAGLLRSVPGEPPPVSQQLAAGFVGSVIGTIAYAVLGALIGQPKMLSGHLVTVALVVGLGGLVSIVPAVSATRWAIASEVRHRQPTQPAGARL